MPLDLSQHLFKLLRAATLINLGSNTDRVGEILQQSLLLLLSS